MARIIPPGFAEAALVFTGQGGTAPYVSTIGVSTNGFTDSQGYNLADYVMGQFGAAVMPSISDGLTLIKCDVSIGLAGGASGSITSSINSIQGGNTQAQVPVAMGCIVQKITNRLGRQGRGRTFLPGSLPEIEVDEAGKVSNSWGDAIASQYFDFLLALATNEVGYAAQAVLLHADGSTPDVIVGARVSPTVGYIRGRIY